MSEQGSDQPGAVPLLRIHEMSASGEAGRPVGIGTLVARRVVLVHPPLAADLASGDGPRLCVIPAGGPSRRSSPIPVLYIRIGRAEAGATDGEPALVVLELASATGMPPLLTRPFISAADWAANARRHLADPAAHTRFGVPRLPARFGRSLQNLLDPLLRLILAIIILVIKPASSWLCKLFNIGC